MTPQTPSLGARLRYSFENTLSKGPVAIIGWLALLSLVIIAFAAVVLAIFRAGYGDDHSFIENFWNSLMRTFDAGNMADDGAGEGGANWTVRFVALAVTLGGIFIISTLIGTITSGIEGKLDELRKGRSKVLESNHTLILGWSPKVFAIISELIIANENQKKPAIVVLADRDKVEMEDEIATRFATTKNTKVICRTGNSLDLDELDISNPHEARSIIILAPEEAQPDIFVIKSILALTNNPNRRSEPYHIVAEIRDEANMEAATLVGGDEAVLVQSADLIARVTAQTCRQSGLSAVYTELLDFDGAEIYFSDEPKLYGKTYRDAIYAYESSTVMGIFTKNEEVFVNPDMNMVINPGDQIIAISEDDDTLVISGGPGGKGDASAIVSGVSTPLGPETTLLLGWNEKAAMIVSELDNYVAKGSSITVVCAAENTAAVVELTSKLENQTLTFQVGNTTERAVLDTLDIPSYDHIILLCYADMEVQEADAKTLITLLHLRNIAVENDKDFSIVSEMLDIRNRALAEVTRADDFIVSDKLVSLMLSQLSENKHLHKVFSNLFSEEGSEIYLKPITDYVQTGKEMDFYTLVESAATRGETAIGYRIAAQISDPTKGYGVNCNPTKSDKLTFQPSDKIIVLAEN
jgi:K+/H+ antiporter YhaU regulatory subunit KhtT